MTRQTAPHEDRAPQAEPLRLASRDISRGIAKAMTLAELEGRVTLLTRRGEPVCALVPLADLARLEQGSTPAAQEGEQNGKP